MHSWSLWDLIHFFLPPPVADDNVPFGNITHFPDEAIRRSKTIHEPQYFEITFFEGALLSADVIEVRGGTMMPETLFRHSYQLYSFKALPDGTKDNCPLWFKVRRAKDN